jgi:hypothetical protein
MIFKKKKVWELLNLIKRFRFLRAWLKSSDIWRLIIKPEMKAFWDFDVSSKRALNAKLAYLLFHRAKACLLTRFFLVPARRRTSKSQLISGPDKQTSNYRSFSYMLCEDRGVRLISFMISWNMYIDISSLLRRIVWLCCNKQARILPCLLLARRMFSLIERMLVFPVLLWCVLNRGFYHGAGVIFTLS